MKKIITLLFIIFQSFYICFAAKLEVKSNLESWDYTFPIEINLIANDKNAKIFYYTDGEWRMDNIKEFKTPLLFKEDTTIDFYASNKNFEDTLIQTSTYSFHYCWDINIKVKNNTIIIQNNSWEIQNIWYWKIEADNLNYEINANTFLEKNEIFSLDYISKDNEKISLISPDKKIIKTHIFQKEKINIQEIKEIVWEKEITNNSWELNKNMVSKTWALNLWDQKEETKDNFSLNSSLKSSILDTTEIDKKNKTNNLYTIFFILFLVTLYNIWLLLRKTEKYKDLKTKFIKK